MTRKSYTSSRLTRLISKKSDQPKSPRVLDVSFEYTLTGQGKFTRNCPFRLIESFIGQYDLVGQSNETGGQLLSELIGYGRVSSRSQSLDIQMSALTKAGVKAEHLYLEKASGTKTTDRAALDDMLSRGVRKADTVVVTRLDRLARSTRDLHNIAHLLEEKGVGLRVLEQNIDTTTPEGRLFFSVLSAISAFETEIRKSRQREGIDAALAKGDESPFKGRPATIDAELVRMHRAEGLTPTEIAKRMGIARSSVYRYLGHGDE